MNRHDHRHAIDARRSSISCSARARAGCCGCSSRLSVAAVGVMIERLWFFIQERRPQRQLAEALAALRDEAARRRAAALQPSRARWRSRWCARALERAGEGAEAVEEHARRDRRARAPALREAASRSSARSATTRRSSACSAPCSASSAPSTISRGAAPLPGHAGRHGRHRRGARRDRRRPGRRAAGGRRVQRVHAPRRDLGGVGERARRTRSSHYVKADAPDLMAGGGYVGGGIIAEINVTPLVDIMLVLLIIFMLTAHLIAKQAHRGRAPAREPGDAPSTDDARDRDLTKRRPLYLDDKPIDARGAARGGRATRWPQDPKTQVDRRRRQGRSRTAASCGCSIW